MEFEARKIIGRNFILEAECLCRSMGDTNYGSLTLPNAVTNIKHSNNINVLM
jgi:hypothetical protein